MIWAGPTSLTGSKFYETPNIIDWQKKGSSLATHMRPVRFVLQPEAVF